MLFYLPRNCRVELSGTYSHVDRRGCSYNIRIYPDFTFRWLGIRLSMRM